MRVSLDLYVLFARVAETGSVSRAARDLGLSKATVSKRLAELETGLGVALVARTTRRLALTEAGARVLRRATRILEEAEQIAAEAGEDRTDPRGRLRIAAPLTFALRWLSPLLPDFMQRYPDIAIELDLDDKTVDLIGDRYDAALRISEMPDSSLTARRLAPVRNCLVAAPSYWAARGKPRRPEDLALHPCFRYANLSSGVYWRFFDAAGTEVRVRVEGPLCVNNGDAELPALRAGLGVAYLPDFIVGADIAAGHLETALPEWRGPNLTLHLLTPPGRGQTRRLRAFSDFLAEQFAGRAPWSLG